MTVLKASKQIFAMKKTPMIGSRTLIKMIILCLILIAIQACSGPRIKKTIRVKEHYENGRLKAKGKKKLSLRVFHRPGSEMGEGVGRHWKEGYWSEYDSCGNKVRKIFYKQGVPIDTVLIK